MHALTLLDALWVVAGVAFTALMVYRAHLTHYETDQLFLSDNIVEFEREEQQEVVHRVEALEPVCKGLGGALALTSALVFSVYFWKLVTNLVV